MNLVDKTLFLRKVSLFQDVSVESLQAIAEIVAERDIAKGDVLFLEGDAPDNMYCIYSGRVEIKKGNNRLALLKEGDFFGELGLLNDSKRAADAIASEAGLLLSLEKEEFMQVIEDLPEVLRAVVKQIIQYLRFNATLKENV